MTQISMGGGDHEAIGLLREGQRSKRLLLLRMIREALMTDPAAMGILPSARSAWDLLSRVQYENVHAFDAILMHPSTGVWASHVLRRLRGVKSGGISLWVEVGHFHTLAAAAAMRAGVGFQTEVPVHDGTTVHFPSLGTVTLPEGSGAQSARARVVTVRWAGRGAGQVAVITARGTCVLLPESLESAAPGWRPLPRVGATTGQHVLRLVLDDEDPYGSFEEGLKPVQLNAQSQCRWQTLVERAWEILVRTHAETADSIADAMCSLVPLAPAVKTEPYSATSPESFGSAMMALPKTATALAVGLVHEFQHVKLGALLDLITLTREEHGSLHYAPWRNDPRPVSGLLQGVYAYQGIVGFWRRYRLTSSGQEALWAEFAYALWRSGTLAVLDDLMESDALTDLGTWFVSSMRSVVGPWCEEPLSPLAESDAGVVAADHRGMWRLRNSQPSPSEVRTMAERWNGSSLPQVSGGAVSVVRADVLPREAAVRSQLVRLKWEDPKTFEWLRRHPESVGASSADIALADGDFGTALRGYAQQVRSRPEASSPWIGLGLALRGHGRARAAAGLLVRPELVRAVYLRLAGGEAAPDPVSVADYVGRQCLMEAAVSPPPHLS
ncbi:HEXXH motif domain-containing protein [Streptomyces iakyrus]|uniref:HEXXH motif domain-containing protein n=1 Tax=Streptomyces iakyrus TaxID=68219 RepID=A0ABW8FRE4_9ACTN